MELQIRIASHMKRNGRLFFETYIDEWDGDCRIYATEDYFDTTYTRRVLADYLEEQVVKKFEDEYPDGEYHSLNDEEEIEHLGFAVREIRGQRMYPDGLNYLIFWGPPFDLIQTYQPEETLTTCAEYLYEFRKFSYVIAIAILNKMLVSSDESSQSDSDSDSEGVAEEIQPYAVNIATVDVVKPNVGVGLARPSNALVQTTGGKPIVNAETLVGGEAIAEAIHGIFAAEPSSDADADGGKNEVKTGPPPAKNLEVNTDGVALQPAASTPSRFQEMNIQLITLESPKYTLTELQTVDFSDLLSSFPMTPQ